MAPLPLKWVFLFCFIFLTNLESATPRDNHATHWAFQPIQKPRLPTVKTPNWCQSPVDYFVLRQLESKKLSPNPTADRATLLRRVYYNLVGLPPTFEEIQTFEKDRHPEALARVVDRLLQSPLYGERWGRHWLDLARYADTKGYVRLQEEAGFPFAFTYRDYVIRSFCEDKPFPEFIREQLAADRLKPGKDNRSLAALGFLTLGRRFTGNKHDVIDDQIDLVSRTFLGLTVACARCHDHKYDPIPTADYYSWYGIFASVREPSEWPVLAETENRPPLFGDPTEYLGKRAAWENFQKQHHEELLAKLRRDVDRYLLKALEGRQPFVVPLPADADEVRPLWVDRWLDYIQSSPVDHPVWAVWHALVPLKAFSPEEVQNHLTALRQRHPGLPQELWTVFNATQLTNREAVARIYGNLFKGALSSEPAPETNPGGKKFHQLLREELFGDKSIFNLTSNEAMEMYLYDAEKNAAMATRRNELHDWLVKTGRAMPRAHSLEESPFLLEPRIFVRGSPTRVGSAVPRRFLSVLQKNARPFEGESGRLGLADAIADTNNPLTPRVLVNRVWQWHFGHGLVRTPSDFGTRAEAPTHPELLDYLAARFIEEGGSIKQLHRWILLSSTWQQSSGSRPDAAALDPENKSLWRMNRQRLDFESMRDRVLSACGRLDLSVGGRGFNLADSRSTRRTVYGVIDRSNLPSFLASFDFPSPDTHAPERHITSVPQQALFCLNSPFLIEQADFFVKSPALGNMPTDARIQEIYRKIFSRDPGSLELNRAREYLQEGPWEEFVQVLLMSNEFMFVD